MTMQKIPTNVRDAAIAEFEKDWQHFGRPTVAAAKIARKYGIGKTTLSDWLRAEGRWPSPRAMRVLELERENRLLEEENQALRAKIRQLEGT